MSETSSDTPHNTDIEQRYSDDQTVNELFQSCAPRQRALLSVLAIADRYSLDPAPIVVGLATESTSSYGFKAKQLAEKLTEGVEPDVALDDLPGLLPPTGVLALKIAREKGTLRAFYSAVLDRTQTIGFPVSSDDDNDFSKLSRLAAKALTIAFFLGFIMLKIIPEFQKMLQEFAVETPILLKLLMSTCDRLVTYWFVFALILIALLPLGFPAIRRYFRHWNPFTWRQPELSPTTTRRRSLAMAAQSGSSLSASIKWILECVPLKRTFKRLEKAQEKIKNGDENWESLAAAKIISKREAKALTISGTPQTQAWLLRWSASNRQNRQTTRSAAGTRLFVTVVNIGLGLLVVLAAVGIFTTLIAIMESLY